MTADEMMLAEATAKLKETVRQGRSFQTAQVKIIGLDDIRRAAGENWSRIGGRVRANSMQFLEGCLTKDDLIIPAGDGFVLIFADLPGRDYLRDSALIQDSLNAFYLGQAVTAPLKAEVKHLSVDSRGMAKLLASGSPSAIGDSGRVRQEEAFAYLPIWNADKEAVTGYWFSQHLVDDHAQESSWDAESTANTDRLATDLWILDRMIEDAEQCLGAGLRCLVNFSVHASTLQQGQRRQAYLRRLYATPKRLHAYALVRIEEIKPGTPIATLTEWVHLLRPVSNRVTLHLDESDRGLAGLDATGAFSVALVLSNRQQTREGRVADESCIQRWTLSLRSQQLKFRIDNLVDERLLKIALTSGVNFITSERFWPTVDKPSGVKIFTRAQLGEVLAAAA